MILLDFTPKIPGEMEAKTIERTRKTRILFSQTVCDLAYELNQPDIVQWSAANAIDLHLLLIQNARMKLVATRLPPARMITDLGAAADHSIYDLGYPHKFDKLIAVDLPPADRMEPDRSSGVTAVETPNGRIEPLMSRMSDLSAIETESIDLVWSGQSIEHVTKEEAEKVYGEVQRILKPNGHFCLDTPNRLMTELHIGTTEWIHPEHKIEYYPEHLQRNLRRAGFDIVDQVGVMEMINTRRQRRIDYRDFYVGCGLNTNLEGSYIQYYDCIKSR